jgi:hypothetical protein
MTIDDALVTVTNDETHMTAFVFPNVRGGFNVTLRDDDSGEFVPQAWIFKSFDAAVAKAHEVL